MFDISLWGAGFAGLLSFLSPCILPIVPFYLTYMAGAGLHQMAQAGAVTPAIRSRAVLGACLFAAGIITIFVGLGASASLFGQALRDWFGLLRWLAAAVILMMGLHFLGIWRIGFLYRDVHMEKGQANAGMSLPGAYVAGLAFAFGWTPCVGPVLAAILFTAAGQDSAGRGAALLLAYGMGMTFPFILAATFIGPFLRWAQGFRRHLATVERIMGAFLILFAFLIATDTINYIAQWMLETFPVFGAIG